MALASVEAFKAAADRNPLRVKEAAEAGRKVVGMYCLYSPMELILAAGAIPVMLCGTRQDPIPAAERTLPRNLCPLIKSSLGFALEETCPYFNAAHLIVADTTCDGKKKMFEQMAAIKPLHMLYLPATAALPEARALWRAEVGRFQERLEQEFGVRIDDNALRQAIDLGNAERDVLRDLMGLMRRRPAPFSGMLLLEMLFKSSFFPDKAAGVALLRAVVQEASRLPDTGQEGPRILFSGVPLGMGSHKVAQLVENAGARVVAYENCTGYKRVRPMEPRDSPLDAIADHYIATPCSIMSPNQGRLELLREMAELFQPDAVVDLTWQACHTYAVETSTVRRFCREELGLPYLNIETDYSDADAEQLKVRIEAFLEML